ncbi:hypothetical protein ACHAXR_002984 [Thalassiosira sp. AJA248-18]
MTHRRAANGDDGGSNSILSGMSQPLLLENDDHLHIDTDNTTPTSTPANNDDNIIASSIKIRRNFLKMSILFAINHGCTVACLGLANARLGSIGVWQSGSLFASYTAAALFGASYFVKQYGSRNGLVLGMGMSASYVISFFLALLIVDYNEGLVWLRDFVAIAGAIVGGIGSSILWVSQGTYFSCSSQLYSSKRGEAVEDMTSKFGGTFAFVFLLFEVILRLLSTFLIETAGLSWKIIFGLYSVLSILPVMLMIGVMDLEVNAYNLLQQSDNSISSRNEEEDDAISPSHKATAALDLLRKDPKTKYLSPYLSPVNILFGLSTAFSSAVLNGEVVEIVLSDHNSTYVGLFTAVTSMVAAGASLLFGFLESSRGGVHYGKESVLTIGILSYLVIALYFLALPNGSDWNRATLLSVYSLLGIGRATYEGTLRALFADLFPNEKEGAFANIILFSGTASTAGYILSVSGILLCKEVSTYCMEYSDGSIHNVFVMELLIIGTAIIAIPALWRAVWLFRKGQHMQNIEDVQSIS